MTFSQRATEQRVIFFHGWWAHRFRMARTGIPIQINILNRGHLAGALENEMEGKRGLSRCYKSAKYLSIVFIVIQRKSFIFVRLTLPGESGLRFSGFIFILQCAHALNKQIIFPNNILKIISYNTDFRSSDGSLLLILAAWWWHMQLLWCCCHGWSPWDLVSHCLSPPQRDHVFGCTWVTYQTSKATKFNTVWCNHR